MFPLYDWYSLKGQLIRKKSFVGHEKTKHPQGCTRVYHIDSMLNFLLKAIPFIFVILSEGYHIISYHIMYIFPHITFIYNKNIQNKKN